MKWMIFNGTKKTKIEKKIAYDLEFSTQGKERGGKMPCSDLKRKSRHE